MQRIYRKDMINFQTKFLNNIKNTLLKRMEIGNIKKTHNHMLIDVLSEIDSRKMYNN